MSAASPERVRIDVWLWRARFFKTRTLSAKAVEAGQVRLARGEQSRVMARASELVGPGDGLTLRLGGRLVSLEIRALGHRRGPAPEAQALYAAQGPGQGGLDGAPDERT